MPAGASATFTWAGTPGTGTGTGTSHTGTITGLGGKCVDLAGGSSTNGTAVQLYDCNGTTARCAVPGATNSSTRPRCTATGPLPGPPDHSRSSTRRPNTADRFTTSKAVPHGSTLAVVGRAAHNARTLRGNALAEASHSRFPVYQVYTAERATYQNLVREVPLEQAGEYRNPYREWIGALIRADIFGYVAAGDPRRAAVLAYRDAILSHRANGLYGEMWAAALVASAFVATSPEESIARSLESVPTRSGWPPRYGPSLTTTAPASPGRRPWTGSKRAGRGCTGCTPSTTRAR